MTNWRQTLSNNILIPRLSPEERQKRRLQQINRTLNQVHIDSDLDLYNTPITNLGNLESVGSYLNLYNTPISRLSKEERDKILSRVKIKGKVWF